MEKIGWIREGAGDRFDDIEREIGGVLHCDQRGSRADAVATMARRFGVTPEVLPSIRTH